MMKRILCLMLAMMLFICLPACHYSDSGDILEPVEFFYPRNSSDFVYGSASGVIGSEVREASGHTDDLQYLITMYLRGPQDSGLRSMFPAGCRLEEVRIEEDTLHIRFSKELSALENTDLTLACAGLAKTCMVLTGLTYIHIDAPSDEKPVNIYLSADSLLLADHGAFETHPEEP